MRCYMVFGHIHGNTDADYWPLIQANERMLNAGVDVNHFEPVTFERWRPIIFCIKVSQTPSLRCSRET